MKRDVEFLRKVTELASNNNIDLYYQYVIMNTG